MMNDLLTVVIVGYDLDSDVWPLTNTMFEKNWGDCPFKTVFVSVEKLNKNSPYTSVITTNGANEYSERLLEAVKHVTTPYVLLLLHDYGLNNNPDSKKLLSFCEFMKEGNYKYCQLGNQYGLSISGGTKIKGTCFSSIKKKKTYRISLQPAIWEKDYLIEIASSIVMESAFDFEIFLNKKDNYYLSYAKACFPNDYSFPYIDILEKGKLSYQLIDYIKENNIVFDTTRQIQTKDDFSKAVKRMSFYVKTPQFIVRIISRLRGRKSFINRKIIRNDRSVVISGANGFLGLLLLKKYHDNGYNVVALLQHGNDNNIDEVKKYSKRIIRTNFEDDSFKIYLYKESEAFIHLAWAGVNGPNKGDEKIQQNNIKMALNAASASSYARIKRFVGIGTVTELSYLNRRSDVLSPSLIYGKYKELCYQSLRGFFGDKEQIFTWLRLSNLYGLSNKTGSILNYEITTILKKEIPCFGPCNQYYDFLLADDAIEAIFRFSLKDHVKEKDLYFIGSGRPKILSNYLLFVAKALDNATINIGARPDDGMYFSKEFFDNKGSVETIGNYVSDSFENNMLKLIEIIKKGE